MLASQSTSDITVDQPLNQLRLPSLKSLRSFIGAGLVIGLGAWTANDAGLPGAQPLKDPIPPASSAAPDKVKEFVFQSLSASEIRTTLKEIRSDLRLSFAYGLHSMIDEILAVDPKTGKDMVDDLFILDKNGDKILSNCEIHDAKKTVGGLSLCANLPLAPSPSFTQECSLSPRIQAFIEKHWEDFQNLHMYARIFCK